ncbi:MAG: RNA polymerase factor sigma-54 [Firmicutes bacterium]|nr:RNA polymerase factor sigma-54 [Bacillota bacterium]
MRLEHSLRLEQRPRLVMTPQLRLALDVLQLPVPELNDFLGEAMNDNPYLESEEEEESSHPEESLTKVSPESTEEEHPPKDEEPESAWIEKLLLEERSGNQGVRSPVREAEAVSWEAQVSAPLTLRDHLAWQLNMTEIPPDIKRVATYIIDSTDENGYLPSDWCPTPNPFPDEILSHALELVQGFDPPGAGARSLEECLLLQLKHLDVEDPILEKLIREHLVDVAACRFPRIAAALGVPLSEIHRAVVSLRLLDPKPGRAYSPASPGTYIIPDVVVHQVDSDYVVTTNEAALPRLKISPCYQALLWEGNVDREVRSFLEDRLQAALWLLKALEQRRLTLHRVSEAIVEFQRDFFDFGHEYLVPLTLKRVAERVGLHESTVSRATAGKYAYTTRGTFPLRFFFSSGVSTDDGMRSSAVSIKRKISLLVKEELPRQPFTDAQIAAFLNRQGILISRRTVAKYREDLGLPGSRHRRRY